MNIDALRFKAITSSILARGTTFTAGEASAIVKLLDLAASVDLDETPAERTLRVQLGRHVCALASIDFDSVGPLSPLPLPIDHEARRATLIGIARQLERPDVRELAFVLAYLVAVQDLAVLAIEDTLISELRTVLGIDRARAEELVVRAVEQATPLDY